MNRIFKKVALRITILFLIVIVAASVFTAIHLDSSYKSDTRAALYKNSKVIESVLIKNDGHDYQDTLNSIDDIRDMRITLIDFDGVVIFDSRADAESLENHSDRPEIITAMESGTGSNIRFSNTLGHDMMYLAIRSDSLGLVVRVSLLLEGVSAYSAELWIPLIVVLILAFMLCLGIALFISRRITQPIVKLQGDMARIAEGRYDGLEKIKTGDEIEELSESLCNMANMLKKNFDAITENHSRLEAVFRAVPGGIVAVDNDLHLIMANPAARGMFSMVAAPEGKHFLEVTQHTQLESVIREAAKSQGVIEREMTILRGMEERYLQVFAVCVFSEGRAYGVILLVQDITRLRKLETLRSDFAANVSHELKTPLTVIRGFTDTLKDEAITREDANRFIEIISIESERLSRLIDDILLLSEIENTTNAPVSVTDLREGVKEALQLLDTKAKDKKIELTVDLPKDSVLTRAEKDRIKQMAINLIDNAIKYTPSGGRVNVKVFEDNGFALLRVEDTGIGIPEDNIPRLFERFYRVDKSRSRALGGTGLGLAIVKHIVNLVGGHITVNSFVGKGSTFTVSLPLDKTPN
jgi:two-component system phosphate regulon sensor histidine kinase PhoR